LKIDYQRKCTDLKDDAREHWWNYITRSFVIHAVHLVLQKPNEYYDGLGMKVG
jgi:hypothetical protein